ncbi:transketolase [Sebaldella sp. S0638]|uniref:transketolase n=1 Tax=Sebaldella sp. S0638 TaxID=2957809 RepID=UPI00209D3610|nr:transketolase [Sebaldella sp. S0638]MCP1223474.1 transketolase [Sebaldella sp. S0638]
MENYNEIKKLAKDIRISMLKMLANLGFGHFGGSLSVVETLAVLYGGVMKIDPKNPDWDERDYMVLSKGHAGPALYAALAIKGYFPREELMTLNINGTHLPSHPDRLLTKGVDATTGSLGQGVSLATGIAMAEKISGKDNRVFTILGDGELNEGQCWEAFQFIAHHNLNNLTVFVDYNKLQLDGTLEEIIKPFSLTEKFKAFGFDSVEVKGDDIEGIYNLVKNKRGENERPLAIILNTKKGQGVEYIENLKNSHHLRLTDEIKAEIEKAIVKLEGEVE